MKQVNEGHGLGSQESHCREHAEAKGYNVEAVFPDDISGGVDFMARPGMRALLSYIDAQPEKSYVVIFDDLKRFARDTRFHLDLRDAFRPVLVQPALGLEPLAGEAQGAVYAGRRMHPAKGEVGRLSHNRPRAMIPIYQPSNSKLTPYSDNFCSNSEDK